MSGGRPGRRGSRPTILNRLATDAGRQWRPRNPPAWARLAGVLLMLAIVVGIVVAVRSGLA